MTFGYRKRLRQRVLDKCAAMRAAKERKRIAATADMPNWQRIKTFIGCLNAAPDGRHVEVWVNGRSKVTTMQRLGATLRDMIARQP